MRFILLFALISSGCEQTFNLTQPTPVTSPGSTVSVSNTNTNTNTATTDKSDTGPVPTSPGSDQSSTVVPLPAYGEAVTRLVATNNPTLLANSCQDKFGESAWQYLDKLVQELRFHAGDTRWGYLCKDGTCTKTARDVVAYKASAAGTWIVDVIGNHCPGPLDPPPAFRWGVLPFETTRPWSEVHK